MTERKLPPIHPGEILLEEFLRPMGLSQYRVAVDIGVPPRRINEIVHGKRGISADTALRLARYFSMSELFWLNLQTRFDLELEKDRLRDRLETGGQVLQPQGSPRRNARRSGDTAKTLVLERREVVPWV